MLTKKMINEAAKIFKRLSQTDENDKKQGVFVKKVFTLAPFL